MTKRLYDIDSHQTETQSRVVSCSPAGDGFDVTLDQTVFFPEGGGQPSDTGLLGSVVVSHVREEDGEIYHRVDRALTVGSTVTGTIDWARRFDLMQQHTGEHLLSFSFYVCSPQATSAFISRWTTPPSILTSPSRRSRLPRRNCLPIASSGAISPLAQRFTKTKRT